MEAHRRIGPEVLAGLAAALMALPTAVGNGLLAWAPLGPGHAASGALSGLVGAVVAGGTAALLGGTPALVTAPSGPAAAMITSLAAEFAASDGERATVLLLAVMCLAGLIQIAFGVLRLGRVAKFIPYPVVAGFLSAAGILLAWGQLPSFTGVGDGGPWVALQSPLRWQAPAIVTALVTLIAMRLTPLIAPRIPPVLAALVAGFATWIGFVFVRPELLGAAGHALRVGGVPSLAEIVATIPGRAGELLALRANDLAKVAGPAAALAALVSFDTLKSCVLVDSRTGGRHAPSRELLAQGLGNALSAVGGGVTSSGVSGATLVNLATGGRSRLSSAIAPTALLALIAFAPAVVGGLPRAILAGVLVYVGLHTVEWSTLRLLRRPGRRLDFVVVVAVVCVALLKGLVVAAGAGFGLVVVLYLRDHVNLSPVRWRSDLGRLRSSHRRLAPENATLEAYGLEAAVLELQGDLFFGTADRLLTELGPDLASRRFVLLDLARVSDFDLTAARILATAHSRLCARHASLLLSGGRSPEALEEMLRDVAVQPNFVPPRTFASLDAGLEFIEEELIALHLQNRPAHGRLPLGEMDLLLGLEPTALAAIERRVQVQTVKAGAPVFRTGDPGDALYMIRLGHVRVDVPLAEGRSLAIGTFGRGDVIGELAFVDSQARSADAVAVVDTELYALSRQAFDAAAGEAPTLATELPARISRVLSYRLRATTAELKAASE